MLNTKTKATILILMGLSVAVTGEAEAATTYACMSEAGVTYYIDTHCTTRSRASNTNTAINTNAELLTDAVFPSTSFWYKPIPADATLDPNSEALVKEFIRQKTTYYNNVNINTYSYSSPVFIANADVTPVKFSFNNCQNKKWFDPTFANMLSAVPLPANAKPSAGTDGEMSIYQPSTNTLWETWGTKLDATTGQWSACWGGSIVNVDHSSGIFQKGYGTTATGLPFIGGQVTAEELARGEIKHVIGIAMVDLEAFWIYSWPANRSDGDNPTKAPNRIAEGQRFRLSPSVNVGELPISKAAKIIALAAQKYGFVVWDKAGSVSIRAQNASSYTALGLPDPYPALYESKPTYAVLNGFPWDKLEFLPMNYGKP